MNKASLKGNLKQSTNTSSDLMLTHFLVSPMNVLCDLIWRRIDLDVDGKTLCYKVLGDVRNLGTGDIVFPH